MVVFYLTEVELVKHFSIPFIVKNESSAPGIGAEILCPKGKDWSGEPGRFIFAISMIELNARRPDPNRYYSDGLFFLSFFLVFASLAFSFISSFFSSRFSIREAFISSKVTDPSASLSSSVKNPS